jgi:hypothetical protein
MSVNNTLLTPTVIAAKAAYMVENNCILSRLAMRDISKDFSKKVGSSVEVRKPVRLQSQAGSNLVIQSIQEPYTNVTLQNLWHIGWDFSSTELTLIVDDYINRYVKNFAIQLANSVDSDGAALLEQVPNFVGTPGTSVSANTIFNASQRFSDFGVSQADRYHVMQPAFANNIRQTLYTNVFLPSMLEDNIIHGSIGVLGNQELFEDQNLPYVHSTGTAYGKTISVAANPVAGETQISLAVNSGTATLVNGDILTFSGTNAVNIVNHNDINFLRQYVVSGGPYTLTTGGVLVTVNAFDPYGMQASGAYQNCTALPTTGSTVTLLDNASTHKYSKSFGFHKEALQLVTVDLQIPEGVIYANRFDIDGISLRMIIQYDPDNDAAIARLDVLEGWALIYPDYCVGMVQ